MDGWTFMTYWWEQSAVYTAPPPLPASCPTLWMGSQTQTAGYCGSSQSQFCGPPTLCHLDEVWHGSPGCRRTWSLGPLDSPVDTQDILSQPDSHRIPQDLKKQSIHFKKCAFFVTSLVRCDKQSCLLCNHDFSECRPLQSLIFVINTFRYFYV